MYQIYRKTNRARTTTQSHGKYLNERSFTIIGLVGLTLDLRRGFLKSLFWEFLDCVYISLIGCILGVYDVLLERSMIRAPIKVFYILREYHFV